MPLHDRPLAQRGSRGGLEDEVGDRGPPRDVKALGLEDSSFWRRERLQGYLTIFTIMTNVVRELVGELNLRSVEAFLRLSNVI